MKTILYSLIFVAAAAQAAASSAPSCNARPNAVSIIVASGDTNYAFGYSVGKATSLQIAARVASTQFATLKSWASTGAGQTMMNDFLKNVNQTFPPYLLEAQGMADGAGLTLTDVMVLNSYDEIETAMQMAQTGRDASCTDLLIGPPASNGQAPRVIAHNEDGRALNLGLMFLLDATVPRIDGDNPITFTTYQYAGTIPTGAFAYNLFGVYFTLNAVFPISVNSTAGIPRMFLHRYLLESRSIDEAVARLTTVRVASGFSVNIGAVGDASSRLLNVEVSAVSATTVFAVAPGAHLYHANEYIHNPTPQLDDTSSDARMARLAVLPAPNPYNLASAKLLLGDTANTSYPIWRSGAPPDPVVTLITAIFEVIDAGTYEMGNLYLMTNNPSLCPDPILTRRFPGSP